MKLPEYVTVDEVKRVCNEIGLRDWSVHNWCQTLNCEYGNV
jgi:hypothetical protein